MLLTILEKTVDGYCQIEDFAYNPGFYAYHGGRELSPSSLSHAISRLKNGGMIEHSRENNKLVWKLTQNAKEWIAENQDNSNWDGKWRVVIWDIPESKRVIRGLFRRNLKKWGFKQYQRSVWISKKDVFEKLKAYIQYLSVEEWVAVFESDRFTLVDI